MFSREESKQIRQEFWTSFGKLYPQKWLLYNTKIKDVTLKFTFTTKKAQVSIDIEPNDEVFRTYYYEKIVSLRKILTSEYLKDIIYNPEYQLENGKIIPRVYVELSDVSIHNKKNWDEVMKFLSVNMIQLETFFLEYKDFIQD
ncbi:DUF4268 domain-containing protein [Aquimarina sp. D1M17]|uniref:DUF4268 domain-containing protein n=1 Tax=Aquimarina acroporae TaxID=2937283 RepID=UPI0020BFE8FD|nr:DUF4268 domain-containing protein [Aquimarina acroporae]MCK8524080.1 DUF4268 domain-containing protein [Aquimarina acroporae]